MDLMNLMIAIMVVGALVLGIIVLYNLGVMSYTERYREMATLKVVGFRDARIGALLVQMTSEYRPELLPQIQQILAQSGVTQDIAQQAQTAGGAPVDAQSMERLGGAEEKQESSITKNARTRVAESTQPR